MSWWGAFTGVLAIAIASATSVAAQAPADEPGEAEEEARALFVAGRTAFDAGRYEEALQRFERSYELSPRRELLYNIAVSYDRLRRDEQALAAYERYLEEPIEPDERRTIQGRIDALRAAIEERRAAAEEREDERARSAAHVSPDPSPDAEVDEGGIATKWWFWALIGAVVVGGATAAIVVAASSGGGVESPIAGDYGVVVMTLGGP